VSSNFFVYVLTRDRMGGTRGNDIWGWEDPQTGKLWAIVCQTSGTAFVDVTDPSNPVYTAYIRTATSMILKVVLSLESHKT
jgi:hypothetical protein